MRFGICSKGQITYLLAEGVEIGFYSENKAMPADKQFRWKLSRSVNGLMHEGYAASAGDAFKGLKLMAPAVLAEIETEQAIRSSHDQEYGSWPLSLRILFDAWQKARIAIVRASDHSPFDGQDYDDAVAAERQAARAFKATFQSFTERSAV